MVDLARIEHLLNTDDQYFQLFLRDPVGALAQQGLLMSPAMQFRLRDSVRRSQAQLAAVPGATISHFDNAALMTRESAINPQLPTSQPGQKRHLSLGTWWG